MALEDALAPIQGTQAPDISIKNAIVKAIRQIYADMPQGGGGVESVTLDPTFSPIDNEAPGNLSLTIDNTDPLNPVINLELVGA